jgi:hypothetical protein
MKYKIVILFYLVSPFIYAQYTEVINSKRPGFSESPFSVGTGVYQVEGGVFYQKSNEETLNVLQKSVGSDLVLRAGLLSEKLEFSLNLKYQSDKLLYQLNPEETQSINGFSQFTVGAKYMIYMPTYKDPTKEIRSWKRKMAFDWNRLIPSVGLYAGLNTNVLSKDYKLTTMSPRVALLLQNDFDESTTWVNNVVVDYFNIKEMRTYGYISTLTYSMTDRFLVFGEHQGMFLPDNREFKLGGGMAYLLSRDLQLGVNLHWDMKTDHLNLYGGIGASYRLDRHQDKVKSPKSTTDGSGKIQRRNQGGFFKNLFKKKNKRR